MIARTSTTDVISSGMGGTRNGALQLVNVSSTTDMCVVPSMFSLRVLKIKTFFLSDAC